MKGRNLTIVVAIIVAVAVIFGFTGYAIGTSWSPQPSRETVPVSQVSGKVVAVFGNGIVVETGAGHEAVISEPSFMANEHPVVPNPPQSVMGDDVFVIVFPHYKGAAQTGTVFIQN